MIKQFTVSKCCGATIESIGALQVSLVCKHCGKPAHPIDETEFFKKVRGNESDNGAGVLPAKCGLALDWVNGTAVVGYHNERKVNDGQGNKNCY